MSRVFYTTLITFVIFSSSIQAADNSWSGFKLGVGIGGMNSQSKDKTTSSHEFDESFSYTTPNDPTSDIAESNATGREHDNIRGVSDSASDVNNSNLDASAGVTDSSTNTWIGNNLDSESLGALTSESYDQGTNIYNRNYTINEYFTGNGFSSNDLSKSRLFGTIEAGYDWQLNDSFVFGLNASFNLSSKRKANGTGYGDNTSGWDESYSYDSRSYSDNGVTGTGGTSTTGATSFTGTQNTNVANAYAPGNEDTQTSSTSVNSFVETGNSIDLGARLGYLATKDTLLFVSGGYSAIKAKQNLAYSSTAGLGGSSSEFGHSGSTNSYNYDTRVSNSDTRHGYYIGAGLETRIKANASIKLEYRYADYGKMTSRYNKDETITDGGDNQFEFYDTMNGSSSLRHQSEISTHSIRAVLNYHF